MALLDLLVLFYITLTIIQAIGAAYFAFIISHEVQPYFEDHDMEDETSNARQAFGYLVAMAVLGVISFIERIFNIVAGCSGSPRNSSCLSNLIGIGTAITILVFAGLTAAHAWGWWNYFAAQGLKHLATYCHGIAAMLITAMVVTVCLIILMTMAICSEPYYLGESRV